MEKSRIFFILSSAFIGGVFGASFWQPREFDILYFYILLVLAITLLGIFYKRPAMIAGFFILFFTLGTYLTEKRLAILDNTKEGNFSGVVMVAEEPERKEQYRNMTIKTESGEKYLVRTGIFSGYNYGDVLKVECQLEIPKNSSGLSADTEFDYRMYLAKEGIYHICQKPEIEIVGENEGNRLYIGILNLKNRLNKKITNLMPSPQSGLLSGLLLGGDDLLSKDYQDAFSRTGTTHIVAVSGYNVTIIAEYLMMLGILLGLWRRQAFWFAAAGIIFFVILVGMPSSAVRAGVIWAIKNGRLANAQNAILFAASLMLLMNPLLLRWDIGFQLSFLATLGIVYIYPIFNEYIVRPVETRQCLVSTIAEIFLLTVAAQAFVLPVIFINFHTFSLISFLANLLVLPIIPVTMLLGFSMIAFSFIFPLLGQVAAWFAFLPLKYETSVIKYLAGLKYTSIEVQNFSWWGVVVWYIIIGAGAVLVKNKIMKKTL